jgi:predicted sulfurtransferase
MRDALFRRKLASGMRPSKKAPEIIATKVCNRCGKEKDADEFYVQASCLGQRSPHCKECHKKAVRARQNRTKKLAQSKLSEGK